MDFLDRLNEVMVKRNIKQKDLCELSKLSKGYISMVMKGERKPNNKLLATLTLINGKGINWWLNGVDDNPLSALNTLIDLFIDEGFIRSDGSMDKEYQDMMDKMLKKSILDKLKKAQR